MNKLTFTTYDELMEWLESRKDDKEGHYYYGDIECMYGELYTIEDIMHDAEPSWFDDGGVSTIYEFEVQDIAPEKRLLALALYEYSNACPEEFIILKENNYDEEDFQKAILKSKEIYDNSRYESVCVVEIDRKVYDDFLMAKRGEDEDYDLSDWQEEHYEDIDTLFTSDDESISEEVYFKWVKADKDLDWAIWCYEHNFGEKIEDGYSIQIGKDLYGDYWFAVDEEDEDLIEDLQSFHNANGRDIHKWHEWYKKEWIIDVTKQEIERLAKYENKGYKWVPKP